MVASGTRFDLVILGATGFTGRLACEYLSQRGPPGLRWAAAGRSSSRLAALSDELGGLETLVCDVSDPAAVERIASQTSVVANYAGTPFIDKALPVIASCTAHGTHYIDITGETPLQRASYDLFNEQAMRTGSLVVHQCGYDSIPSDIGAFLAVHELRTRFGCSAAELKSFAGSSKGGVSGGTLATVLKLLSPGGLPGVAAARSRGSYPLDPVGAEGGPDRDDWGGRIIGYDERAGTWHAPFFMAASNAPVVRKSAALLEYGRGCRYSEVQAVPSAAAAVGVLCGLVAAVAALVLPPLRALLFGLRLLPRPGEGPSKAQRDTGHFHMYTLGVGEGRDAALVMAHVRSGTAGDPGYKGTALMSVEAALCLAVQRDSCASSGGVLTPASALGHVLVDRLRAAGMQLTVGPVERPKAR